MQLVVIDVFAKDSNGNPIEGLKPDDFTVSEDGKPQKITTFQYQALKNEPVAADEALAPAPSLTTRGPVLGEAKKPDAGAAVKSVTANQITPAKAGEVKYKDRRLMVLFFDMTSMPINDQMRAQDSAIKFVKTQITPSDLVAIMTFSADVKVVEDFTDDRDKLIKDIKGIDRWRGPGFRRHRHQRRRVRHRRGLLGGRFRIQYLQHRPPVIGARRRPPKCWARCPKRRPWCTSPAA